MKTATVSASVTLWLIQHSNGLLWAWVEDWYVKMSSHLAGSVDAWSLRMNKIDRGLSFSTGMIQNYWSNWNISDSFGRTCSKLQHSLEILSFDIDAVLQANWKMPSGILLWGLFSALNSPLWRGLGHEKTSSQLVCLSREEGSSSRIVHGRDCTVGGARLGFFVRQDTELWPFYCGDWHCRGGGRSW